MTKAESMKLTGPHKSPVLDFDWHNSLLVSGDKDGFLIFWVRVINLVQSKMIRISTQESILKQQNVIRYILCYFNSEKLIES